MQENLWSLSKSSVFTPVKDILAQDFKSKYVFKLHFICTTFWHRKEQFNPAKKAKPQNTHMTLQQNVISKTSNLHWVTAAYGSWELKWGWVLRETTKTQLIKQSCFKPCWRSLGIPAHTPSVQHAGHLDNIKSSSSSTKDPLVPLHLPGLLWWEQKSLEKV